MANSAILELRHSGLDGETDEILNFAKALSERAAEFGGAFDGLIAVSKAAFSAADDEQALESACEDTVRDLRQLWIETSAASAARCYRSPSSGEDARTATGRRVEFGYERDLRPAYLEERCARFFDAPPEGWTADHILFSSGQAAMTSVLHALDAGADDRITVAHLGSYFETAEMLSLFQSLLRLRVKGRRAVKAMEWADADLTIVEPVFCDGEFGAVDVTKLVAQHAREPYRPRAYVFDATLSGTSFPLESLLPKMAARGQRVVFRTMSGLKLLQGGLELANVGVLSIFAPQTGGETAPQWGERIRRIRTLLGLGLSFADVAALEAPWFLDRSTTERYQRAIFDNNAALAQAVAHSNRLFRGVFHPALIPGHGGSVAPYCAFRLASGDTEEYAILEEHIAREAAARGVLFARGGSFGFRGHRFEVVRPEDGTEPFLRVAMGRRIGSSLFDVIKLMSDIARTESVSEL